MSLRTDHPTALARAVLWSTVALIAWLFWQARHQPILSTDALIYHAALPAAWLHTHVLAPLDLPFVGGGVAQSPAFTILLNHLLLSLTHTDTLLRWVQPLTWLALLLVFWRSARLCGATPPLAHTLTALLALFPPFLNNAQFVQNDLILTLGVALSLYGLLLARARPAPGALWTCAGVALATLTKAVGLIYGALAVLALAPTLRTLLRNRRWTPLLASLVMLALGSAFFWRNLLVYGNPMFPGTLALGGVTLFPGIYDFSPLVDHGWAPDVLRRMLLHGPEPDDPKLAFSAPLLLGWALAWPTLRRRPGWTTRLAVLLFPALGFVLVFSRVPYWPVPRYVFPVYYALWLGATLALVGWTRPRRHARPHLSSLGLAAVVVLIAYGGLDLSMAAVATLAALAALTLPPAWRRPTRLGGALAVLTLASLAATWHAHVRARDAARADAYVTYYAERGVAWNLLERLTRERGATVAYAGSPMIYPLFGAHRQNRVVYLPLSDDDRPQPVDLHGRPPGLRPDLWVFHQDALARRSRVDPSRWFAALEAQQVDYLLLADDPWRGGVAPELELIASAPERFRFLFEADGVWLLRVLRD